MNRLLIDRSGAYDLARVAAITTASYNVRDPNSPQGPGIPTKVATLHLDGGQVLITETEINIAMQAWREVKETEDERETARASIFSDMYNHALETAHGKSAAEVGNDANAGTKGLLGKSDGSSVGDSVTSGG